MAVPGKSYCEDHIHIVYQEGTAIAPRKRDQRRIENQRQWETALNEAITELEQEGFL